VIFPDGAVRRVAPDGCVQHGKRPLAQQHSNVSASVCAGQGRGMRWSGTRQDSALAGLHYQGTALGCTHYNALGWAVQNWQARAPSASSSS
jgi:hypothetical protein